MQTNMAFSIQDRLAICGERSTGFDYLRISLAISVLLFHSMSQSTPTAHDDLLTSHYRPLIATVLPMFFALSGFLIAGSLQRNTIPFFLFLRFLRIYPALISETIICAFLLGPILTALPSNQYFSHPMFFKYMLNTFGDVHFFLPGLFDERGNLIPLNGQLWTVPFELECYIFIAAAGFLGITKKSIYLFASIFIISIAYIVFKYIKHDGAVEAIGAVNGEILVASFLAGVYIFLNKTIIPYNKYVFLFSVMIYFILLSVPLGDAFVPLPAAYITVFLGLRNPNADFLHKFGDLSYGIFLFGAPIEIALSRLTYGWARPWILNFAISFPLAALVALGSWNLIEKPALSLRKVFPSQKRSALKPADSEVL